VQAMVAAMKAVVNQDVSGVIESLEIMTKALETIMNSMETLKSQSRQHLLASLAIRALLYTVYRLTLYGCGPTDRT